MIIERIKKKNERVWIKESIFDSIEFITLLSLHVGSVMFTRPFFYLEFWDLKDVFYVVLSGMPDLANLGKNHVFLSCSLIREIFRRSKCLQVLFLLFSILFFRAGASLELLQRICIWFCLVRTHIMLWRGQIISHVSCPAIVSKKLVLFLYILPYSRSCENL